MAKVKALCEYESSDEDDKDADDNGNDIVKGKNDNADDGEVKAPKKKSSKTDKTPKDDDR